MTTLFIMTTGTGIFGFAFGCGVLWFSLKTIHDADWGMKFPPVKIWVDGFIKVFGKDKTIFFIRYIWAPLLFLLGLIAVFYGLSGILFFPLLKLLY